MTLVSEGSFIDAELVVRAQKLGFNIVQFGVDYFPRTRGVSTLSSPARDRQASCGRCGRCAGSCGPSSRSRQDLIRTPVWADRRGGTVRTSAWNGPRSLRGVGRSAVGTMSRCLAPRSAPALNHGPSHTKRSGAADVPPVDPTTCGRWAPAAVAVVAFAGVAGWGALGAPVTTKRRAANALDDAAQHGLGSPRRSRRPRAPASTTLVKRPLAVELVEGASRATTSRWCSSASTTSASIPVASTASTARRRSRRSGPSRSWSSAHRPTR